MTKMHFRRADIRSICYSIREEDYDSFLFKNLGCLSEFMKRTMFLFGGGSEELGDGFEGYVLYSACMHSALYV
jgi:hypothetical protein